MTCVFSIGHSTRSSSDFIKLLRAYRIEQVIDIRSIPKSRHNPQFNGPDLARALRSHHIGYRHQKNLGGLRRPHANSINTAWKNSSFRGFADYMLTTEFNDGIAELIAIATLKTVAIMCAEALPWRCHRSLLGDALLIRGVEVRDIMTTTSCKLHTMTEWAVADEETVFYPGDGS